MPPKTLALIDDDAEYGTYLARYLLDRGVVVRVFTDSAHFLADENAYGFDFYLVDLSLPSADDIELIRIARLRTSVGVLVVSGRESPDVFASIVKAGADMFLAKPVHFEQVALAVEAVHRRSGAVNPQDKPWRLDRRAGRLLAPDGTRRAAQRIGSGRDGLFPAGRRHAGVARHAA